MRALIVVSVSALSLLLLQQHFSDPETHGLFVIESRQNVPDLVGMRVIDAIPKERSRAPLHQVQTSKPFVHLHAGQKGGESAFLLSQTHCARDDVE